MVSDWGASAKSEESIQLRSLGRGKVDATIVVNDGDGADYDSAACLLLEFGVRRSKDGHACESKKSQMRSSNISSFLSSPA